MPSKIIACEVMREELLSVIRDQDMEYEFISMGLHLYPDKLRLELQRIVEGSEGYSRIILAFGLCGGAARGLRAVHGILTIPRVHDCLPLLLGSKQIFERHRKEEVGTFYISGGWMRGEKSIVSDFERIREKYGEAKALKIISRMYDGYRRILFIHTDHSGRAETLERAEKTARLLKLRLEITEGKKTYLEKIVKGPWEEDEFIHVLPGGVLQEDEFLIDK